MTNALRRTPIPQIRPLKNTVKRQHIIFISDDIELAETLQMELSQQDYRVNVVHDGLRGLLAAKRMRPDLVILSWSPPRLSGLEICARLRTNRQADSIILITRENCSKERIAGFNAGADDCLSLPLIKDEFIARVNANLSHRHHHHTDPPTLRVDDLMLNRKTREVFRGEHFIRLTAKEFNLLEYLMLNHFQVLTRAQILENVWGYDYNGNSNIIEVYVRYLRKKLRATPDDPIIHTVRSVGYILRETI